VSFCRGARISNTAAEPFVRVAISSQRSAPGKIPAPKSTLTVNKPLVTETAEFVTGPLITAPPTFVANRVKVRS
jgi:hypothetical protein